MNKNNLVIITYKLTNPGKDYMPLYATIKFLAFDWWHSFDAFWLVRTSIEPAYIKEALTRHLDSRDELIVARLDGNLTGYISNDLHQWLTK